LGIFKFLTTFRCACDAAGLTHGQALPLMVFRLSGNAKMAFSGALNSTLGRKRYAIRTYGDAVNWLLSKYATNATMANAYQDIITMKQQDNEASTALGDRVETLCDLLNGLFDIQDVKDVFKTGLSDLVQAHVRNDTLEFLESLLRNMVVRSFRQKKSHVLGYGCITPTRQGRRQAGLAIVANVVIDPTWMRTIQRVHITGDGDIHANVSREDFNAIAAI